MSKKLVAGMMCLVLLLSFMTACGKSDPPPVETASPPTSSPEVVTSKNFDIQFRNSSDYIFNEIYVSPAADSEWGPDHLGSTSILKKGGVFTITLEKYDFENYDILVVDEDLDEYLFNYVKLSEGCEVEITFDGGLSAIVTATNGTSTIVSGELSSASSGTGTSTPGAATNRMSFTIYNESPYDIYAVYIKPANSNEEFVDILPYILTPDGYSYNVELFYDDAHKNITEWTMEVEDTDGDDTTYLENFNPWTLSYVDINWESSTSGYNLDFKY